MRKAAQSAASDRVISFGRKETGVNEYSKVTVAALTLIPGGAPQ
jgi:hypothetical protein